MTKKSPTNELEKEKPDISVIQRAWKILEATAPTLENFPNISSNITSFLE